MQAMGQVKNPAAPAMRREAEEEWRGSGAGKRTEPGCLLGKAQFSSKKHDVANVKLLRIPHKGKQGFRVLRHRPFVLQSRHSCFLLSYELRPLAAKLSASGSIHSSVARLCATMTATSLSDPTRRRRDSFKCEILTYYHAMAYEDHWLPGFNFNV
jgi:hypothetical protein